MSDNQIPTNNPYGLFNPINPWPGLAAPKIGPGRPAGTKLKDKDTLVQECVDKLSGHIASLCNKYNISENADIQTEIDLVETANYTTVILTATIDIPVHFTFVVQEKIKTSNKTNVGLRAAPMMPAQQAQQLTNPIHMDKLQKQMEDRQNQNEIEVAYNRSLQQVSPWPFKKDLTSDF